MPASSKAQQAIFAIGLHSPEKLHKKNRGILSMSRGDMSDYAETKTKDLPKHSTLYSRKK